MKKFGILMAAIVLAGPLVLAASHNPADAKDKVKVGFIGSLTGGTSANGLGGRNSADLAVRLRNADPKAKYEYEMISLDDECKPNVGVQQATKLAADKEIIAAATHYCSAVAIATVDTYHKFGLPVIVWGAVLPDITYRNKYAEVHRVNGTMINQNQRNAELLSKLGYKTFAVIHDTTDYGKGHNKYFSEALAKAGGKIVGTFGVTSDQQDFSAELTQIKSLNPEAIYFGGLTPIGVRIRAQMDKLGPQQRPARRHVGDQVRRLYRRPRQAGGRLAILHRRRADRAAARRQVLPREVQRPELPQPARGLRRLRASPP